MTVEQKLAARGLALPVPPQPLGAYRATVEANGTLRISGQVPLRDGQVVFKGRVGEALTVEQGKQAAELTALNVLAQIHRHLGGFDRLVQLIHVEGYVASAEGFYDQPGVIDAASNLFADVLGDKAGHTRAVFSQTQLPANAAIILVVTAQIEPQK